MKQFTKNLNHKQTHSSVNLVGRLRPDILPLAPFVFLPLKNDTALTSLLKKNKSLKHVVCLSFSCHDVILIHFNDIAIMRVFLKHFNKGSFK